MRMEQKLGKNMIDCRGVSKAFADGKEMFQVVENLDLQVGENEFLVLFGAGQCGKTTIINLIAGLETPDAGTIIVDGKKVVEPEPDRGVVFQSVALFPWMTAMENIEYGPKMRGVDKETRRKRAQYYIDLVGLQGFENAYPIKLSGGMKQRVGIARAYCNEPSVLLMDEPFSALDAQTRYLMQEELGKIWQKEKRTVVFVTNNVEEAIYLADRIVVLKNCPTSVKTEFEINLPRPRNYVDEEFLKLRQTITAAVDKTR